MLSFEGKRIDVGANKLKWGRFDIRVFCDKMRSFCTISASTFWKIQPDILSYLSVWALLHSYTMISIHTPSDSFIQFLIHSFTTIYIQIRSFTFIYRHIASYTSIRLHLHSHSIIKLHTFLFKPVYYHLHFYTILYSRLLPYWFIYIHTLSYAFIYHHKASTFLYTLIY